MDFLRLLAAAVFGVVVYSAALGSVPIALGLIAFLVMLTAGWGEARFERLANAIEALQRKI